VNGPTATAVLGVFFLAAGTALVITEHALAGALMLIVAVFSLLTVIGMAYNDARGR